MIPQKTQSAKFWDEEFQLDASDLDDLTNQLSEDVRPYSTDELARSVVERRVQAEDAQRRAELSKGPAYQPKDDYQVGQEVIFPQFNFSLGKVVGKRAGQNPEHGDFNVIEVAFSGQRARREFAAGLTTLHALNRAPHDDGLTASANTLSPVEIYNRHKDRLRAVVIAGLSKPGEDRFARWQDQWMAAEALADVHVGLLNIAEALVDMKATPQSTPDLIKEMDLPREIAEPVREFSVNQALSKDPRFVQVGTLGQPKWFLARLLPPEAREIPARLQYQPIPYRRSALNVDLLQAEYEIGDEWSEPEPDTGTSPVIGTPARTSVVLIYPHRRSGTLPLNNRTRTFFPDAVGRPQITLVDGRWGQRFKAVLVPEGRYLAGLAAWYEQHKLPVGSEIVLERSRTDPGEVIIDFLPRRMKREWTRVARVDNDHLNFEMQKQPIACEVNEQMVLGYTDDAKLDTLWQLIHGENWSVERLVSAIFPELVKLSAQGNAHARTLYSAVNLLRRLPPGPVFAALATNPAYRATGAGYYVMA